jgi:NAD(P)-dependent dehydrogenase (short-subunit alcohol dehydrogenase family)
MHAPSAFVTSLILGANRGIGLELCRQLHERGDRVIGVCRKASEELKQLGLFKVLEDVDISKAEQVEALTQAGLGTIDNLWCNAGIGDGIEDDLESLDFASIMHSFNVNALGPLRTVQTLLPNLKKGSKVK